MEKTYLSTGRDVIPEIRHYRSGNIFSTGNDVVPVIRLVQFGTLIFWRGSETFFSTGSDVVSETLHFRFGNRISAAMFGNLILDVIFWMEVPEILYVRKSYFLY